MNLTFSTRFCEKNVEAKKAVAKKSSPKKVVNVINLSQNAHYEILDANGISLIKGSGVQISIANLKVGEYYINIDNRTEKFTKH